MLRPLHVLQAAKGTRGGGSMASGPCGARDEAPSALSRDGGGTSRSRLRCSIGDSRGNRARKGSFQPKQHLVEKLKLLGLDGGREKEQLCSWHRIPWDAEASGSGHTGAAGAEEPIQDQGSSMSQVIPFPSILRGRSQLGRSLWLAFIPMGITGGIQTRRSPSVGLNPGKRSFRA